MKNVTKDILVIILFCLLYFSCTYESVEGDVPVKYFFNPNNTTVKWTAYKFTTKFGVSGFIEGFKFETSVNSASRTGEIKNILKNMKFAVVPNLIKQDSTLKHINIQNHFFDKLNTKNIYGKIINIDLENVAGTATVELTFNGVKKLLNAKYTITKNIIELNTTFNLNDFNAINALDSLAKQCYELHKGADGISKTWPDIEISVVSILNNDKL